MLLTPGLCSHLAWMVKLFFKLALFLEGRFVRVAYELWDWELDLFKSGFLG